jgi:hypothetical protein
VRHCDRTAGHFTAVLISGSVTLAQPVGITPEMINRSLPLEGAPLAVPGPYKVSSEGAFGSSGLVVYRPAALEAFPKKDSLPVMVWGNGGCAIDSTCYSGFLTTIASHGLLVLGRVPQDGASRRQETADDVRATIDWAAKENARTGSPLKGKIALDKVAVMGRSCGGFLSIGVFNSGVQEAAPAFYGSRHNAGHTATVFHPSRGEFAKVASNWLSWTFKGDTKAGQMFVGKNCGLCTNSNPSRTV